MNTIVRRGPISSAEPAGSLDDLLGSLKASVSYRTLEPRMAFDGAAATTAATVADQPDSGSSDASDTASHAADSDTAVADGGNGDAPVADDASAPDDGTTNSEILAQADAAPNSARTTIVFIDRNVENIEQIIAGIDASHEIVLLETDESGLDQIAAFLADRNDVESIHIVSHGETGTLYLGSDTITSANLDSFQADLAAIGAALSDDGDILIYGCDVASGTGGMAFIRSISEATGADVAASIDSTGGDEAGGDWVLEATAGAIDAKSLDNPMYAGLLSKTNTGAGGNTWNISGATATNSTDGITTTVNVSASGTGTWNSIANNTLATATAGNGLTAATFDNGALGSGSLNLQWNTTVATETATVTFTFSSAVTNPVLHLDRLGGFSGAVSQSNSSVWTLATAGATLTKVAGVNHFIVDSLAGTISRRVGDTTVSASEADSNTAEGTAAGSVRINGTFTTLTFTLRMAIPTGGTAIGDGLEIALAIDAPPIAANDTFTTAHDVPATINVRANDSDVRGDAINVTRVNGTSIVAGGAGVSVTGGVVTLNASGNLVFTPTANYSGAPSFTYTIADANGGTATATVSGTVTNATPVLDLDASGAGTGWTTTYTENGSAISIADLDAAITDTDDANIESGAVTLTNAQTGDRLLVGGSSATSGTIGSISWTRTDTTVTLTGTATKAQYAAAIQSIQFENTTDMAGAGQTTPRIINATVNDGHINSAIAVTTINIDLTPDPVNDTASGAEDTTISGNVLTNDSDLGTTPITSVTVAAGPTNGTLTTFNTSTGAFVYTPNANFNGTDTFTYTLTDADGDTRTATVTITVTPVNDAPLNTLPATIGPVAEDATLAITGVSVADIDSAALTTTVSIGNGVLNLGVTGGATVSGAGTGAITLSGTASQINAALATLTYTPTADYNGTATFQMVTSDGALSDTDSRTITISPVVDIANNAVSTNEDAAVTFAPLGNDSFENAGAVITAVAGSAISAGGPGVAVTGGVVTLDGAGNLTFTPTANFNGPSAFTYTVTSGGVTEQATITVTVNAINDAPTQTVPGAQTTAEDTVRVISGASVADVDGGTLTTTLTIPNGTGALSVITGGGATISGNGTTSVTVSGTAAQINAAIASITFTPLADYNGAANLTMATNDGTITTSNVIAMTVTPVADITNDAMSVNEDTAHSFNAITGTNGATADTFEGSPSVTSVTQPANGSVTFAANGAMTYTPGSNFSGTDTFTYTVTSGGVVETATVTITVNAVNDAPINTVPGAQTTVEDTALIFSAANGNAITVADVDSTLTSTLTIANGTLTLGSISGVTVTGNGTGTLTVSGSASAINAALSGLRFQPTADWNGSTSLSLSTSDGVAPAAVNTVAITASAVIDVASDTVTTAEDTARTFNVLGNDSFEGAPVVTSVTQPAHGVVSIGSGGNVTYTPAANYNGPDSFTYTVTSGGVTETTTVSLTVTPVNDAPTVGAASAQTSVDGAADSYNVGALFADLDGDALTFSASGLPAGLTINATTGLISGTVGNHAS
ncbi:MAG: tandem-95 repeat protein, partial [Hyphomicrobium sp.]